MNSQIISFSSGQALAHSQLRRILSLAFSITILFFVFTAHPPASRADDKTRIRAERALREGDFELAEKLFRELLTKDATDKPARLGLSYALLKRGNLLDAYDHAARVIASDPLSARAHALLGSSIL